MTDLQLGTTALKAFWSWSKSFYPTSFTYTFDQFLALYGKKKDIYADGIGGAIRETDLSSSKVESSMRVLAQRSGGKIPKDHNQYIMAFSDQAAKINYLDAIVFTATESIGDIANGAAELGDSLITTGKIINFLLPALGVIFVLFWFNSKTDGSLGKIAKAAKGMK